jgi:hypothetical protein
VATLIAAGLALAGGAVRLLPWLLDPEVTWRVAGPFARSLSVVALEAALAVGWPIGWALASQAFVERGEARVLALLGERPGRTTLRLLGQGLLLGVMLGGLSYASARESTEPGRVVSDLIAEGRDACGQAREPRTYTVPFFEATWLCGPGLVPRLAGQGPGRLGALTFTASNARVSGDLGTVDFVDAHLALGEPKASLHVDTLHVQGTAPWGHASTVSPLSRALALSAAVSVAALTTAFLIVAGRDAPRLVAWLVGASGPIVALALLRAVERGGTGSGWAILAVPAASFAAPCAAAWVGARLPRMWHAASKKVVRGSGP